MGKTDENPVQKPQLIRKILGYPKNGQKYEFIKEQLTLKKYFLQRNQYFIPKIYHAILSCHLLSMI